MQVVNGIIRIRSANIEDAPILVNWWNDGRIMAHAGFSNGLCTTLEKTIEQINLNEKNLSQICIIEAGDNRIGECNFKIRENTAEIGIKICDVSYQGIGLGTKILQLLIDYLFTDRELNNKVRIEKINLDTNLNNTRAQHVYEKLGFIKTAVNIDSWKNQMGEWQSSVDYQMTLADYISKA